MSVAVVLISLILRWYLGHLNGKKIEVQSSVESSDFRQQSLEVIGDLHPGTLHMPLAYYSADHVNRLLLYYLISQRTRIKGQVASRIFSEDKRPFQTFSLWPPINRAPVCACPIA